jgi:hypothetical protein
MTKLKMTHNEYNEYSKKNLSRTYDKNEPSYGFNQYLEDVKNVEIIPYNLSDYNLPEEIEKAINGIFTEETTSKKGEYMLVGFSESRDDWHKITDRLGLKRTMGYYYSGYCYSENQNMYMTYSEGDLYLKLFKCKEDYDLSLQETIKFYEEN